MSEVVGAYAVGAFTEPQNGEEPIDADQVRLNDNTIRGGFNNHDADPGVHFQGSTFAARPAAGSSGRKWFSSDTKQVFRDNGTSWDEVDYLNKTNGGTVAGNTTFTGTVTSTSGSRSFGATTFTGAIAGTSASFSSSISSAGAAFSAAISGTSASFSSTISAVGATFTAALAGTSAIFSSTFVANGAATFNGGIAVVGASAGALVATLTAFDTATTTDLLRYERSGGAVRGVLRFDNTNKFQFGSTTAHSLDILSNNAIIATFSSAGFIVNGLPVSGITTFAASGVATFSGSSVDHRSDASLIRTLNSGATVQQVAIGSVLGLTGAGSTTTGGMSTNGDMTFYTAGSATPRLTLNAGAAVFGSLALSGITTLAATTYVTCTTAVAASNPAFFVNSHAANPLGIEVQFSGSAPNDTTHLFYRAYDNAADRFAVRSNGGVANFSANNVNLSDERLKTDVRDLESMWTQHLALRVVRGKFKDQTHDDDNYMGIAQNIEAVFPELVDDVVLQRDRRGKPTLVRKGIFETDLNWITRAVVQECQRRIAVLERKVS